jgi:hypothetical protein
MASANFGISPLFSFPRGAESRSGYLAITVAELIVSGVTYRCEPSP